MKPLPAQTTPVSKAAEPPMPSLPTGLSPQPGSYSKTNRRAAGNPGQKAYPWLLAISTGLAATFCLMYITKPVIVASQGSATVAPEGNPALVAKTAAQTSNASLLPSQDRLPGEKATSNAAIASSQPKGEAFEQTNLRIQHILTAEAPGGHIAKIDLEVPVLYQSRNLRWTTNEVAEARELLARLADYQEKTQTLRAEGAELLDAWNRLVGNSIPAGELRADSPTLPANQQDSLEMPRPAGLNTTELIKIQPDGK